MGGSRLAGATILIALLLAPPTRAEPSVPPASPVDPALARGVQLELRGSLPGLRLEVQDPRSGHALAYCEGACRATIVPGRYRFFANATADTRAGGRDIDILAASRVLISPASQSRRSTGLTLGITGSALVLVGAVLFLSNPSGGSSSELGTGDAAVAGLVMALTGAVLTPIGWAMFGTSHRPKVQVTPLER